MLCVFYFYNTVNQAFIYNTTPTPTHRITRLREKSKYTLFLYNCQGFLIFVSFLTLLVSNLCGSCSFKYFIFFAPLLWKDSTQKREQKYTRAYHISTLTHTGKFLYFSGWEAFSRLLWLNRKCKNVKKNHSWLYWSMINYLETNVMLGAWIKTNFIANLV